METFYIFLAISASALFTLGYVYKTLSHDTMRAIFHWLLTSLYRVKVKGLEHYYAAGERVVIVSNHN